jgi:hypothetical protein
VIGLIDRYVPRLFYASIEAGTGEIAGDRSSDSAGDQPHDADAARVAMAQHITHSGDLLAAQFVSGPSPT